MCMKVPNNIKEVDNDITDDEWDKLHLPFNNNLNDFMIKYVIPEVVAFQLANSYYRECLGKDSLNQHFRSMRDIINVFPSLDEVKDEIVELLRIKYNLTIVNESPLILEKYQ